MAQYAITQSTTTWALVFLLVQSSDHVTGLTGASPTVTISKNGGAFASPAGAVTEVANGWYKVAGNATDTNTLGPLVLHATATSGDPTDVVFEVVAYAPQDAVRLGLTAMPNANAAASGGLLISGSNSGTTTLAALTVTGSFTVSDGLLISRSTSNASAITATGNGTGSGVVFTSGSGATGDGLRAVAASTNGNGATMSKTGSGNDLNATVTPLTLVKTTNITGFNDIAATAVVSAGAITTSGGAISTVTNLTNAPTNGDLTAAMIASVTTAATAATPTAAAVTAAVTVSGTSPLTEAYAGKGTALTLASALYGMHQQLGERSTSGTTITVKKRDQSTTAQTFTLDDATTTTSIAQAT